MGFFDSFGQDYVASMENAIDAAEVRGNSYAQLPDGKYQMYVKSLAVKESNQLGGYPNFIIQLTVVEGEYAGRSAFKRYPLEPDKIRMDTLKSDLALLGVEFKSLYDLEDEALMTKLLDQIVDVQIKSKVSKANGKSYPNYYLNRVVGTMAGGSADDDPYAPVDPTDTPLGPIRRNDYVD